MGMGIRHKLNVSNIKFWEWKVMTQNKKDLMSKSFWELDSEEERSQYITEWIESIPEARFSVDAQGKQVSVNCYRRE